MLDRIESLKAVQTHEPLCDIRCEDVDVRGIARLEAFSGAREKSFCQPQRVEKRRVTIAGKLLPKLCSESPYGPGQTFEIRLVVASEISTITAEQFIATDTGKNDCDISARKLRHKESRDECGVGNRLVHVP